MKRRLLASIFLSVFFFLSTAAVAGDHDCNGDCGHGQKAQSEVKAESSQTTCPVMGGAVDKTVYADHDGKRVYFCCEACVKAFEKEPDKYIEKLENDGVKLEKTPASSDA